MTDQAVEQPTEAETAKVKFGIVDSSDPQKALEQLLSLDSDSDGTPNYRDPAPFDSKVSVRVEDYIGRAPEDAAVRRLAGLDTEAATYRRKSGVPDAQDQWGKDLMHSVTKTGGFTFHNVVGDGPTNGYMVSVAKRNEQKVPMKDLTPEHVADYMSVHQQELKDPNNYLGGWVYKGNVYLDISRHTQDRREAFNLARANKQIGIYDIGKGDTLLTHEHDEAGNRIGQPGQPAVPKAAYVVGQPTAEQVDDPAKRLAFADSFVTGIQRAARAAQEE